MREKLGQWIATSRAGRVLPILATFLLVATAIYIMVSAEVGRQAGTISTRLQLIEVSRPCGSIPQAQNRSDRRRLVRSCISYLDALGPFISRQLACSILERGEYPCPRSDSGSKAAAMGEEGSDDKITTGGSEQNSVRDRSEREAERDTGSGEVLSPPPDIPSPTNSVEPEPKVTPPTPSLPPSPPSVDPDPEPDIGKGNLSLEACLLDKCVVFGLELQHAAQLAGE